MCVNGEENVSCDIRDEHTAQFSPLILHLNQDKRNTLEPGNFTVFIK